MFKKKDGARSYVAYNPGTIPLTVTFSDGARLMDIPANAMAHKTGKNGTQTNDVIGKSTENKGRLYLRKPVSYPASCDALTPRDLSMEAAPGVWKPSAGITTFPNDANDLADSIVCVPTRPQQKPPTYEPDPKYIRTWKGTFSGKRVAKNPENAFTRFAVYSNQSLFPGWQYDPATQGTPPVPSNCFVVNIIYDFNGDGKNDRWEQYPISPIGGNSFVYQNKPTQYDFDQNVWPRNDPPMILGGPTGTMKADFPTAVSYGKGKITVKIWGGATRSTSIGSITGAHIGECGSSDEQGLMGAAAVSTAPAQPTPETPLKHFSYVLLWVTIFAILPWTTRTTASAVEIFNRYVYSNPTRSPAKTYEEDRTITGHQGASTTLAFRLSLYGSAGQKKMPLLVQVHEWGGDFARMEDLACYIPTQYEFVMLYFQFKPSTENETNWWFGTHWEGVCRMWTHEAVMAVIREVINGSLVNNQLGSGIDLNRVYLLTGSGTADVTLRRLQAFKVTPGATTREMPFQLPSTSTRVI